MDYLEQPIHVHALAIQRLVEVPLRVDGGRVGLGMTKHRLTNGDVLRRFVCPRAETVPAMPHST